MIALRWSERREREGIVRHLARCSFFRALLAYNHANADEERLAFTRRAGLPLRAGRSAGSLRPLPAGDGSAILVPEDHFPGGEQ